MGAEVVDSVAQQTTIVLSSQTEVTKKSAKIKIAEKHSIPILPVSFLEEAKAGDALSKVLSLKISDWGAVVSIYFNLLHDFICCKICLGILLIAFIDKIGYNNLSYHCERTRNFFA